MVHSARLLPGEAVGDEESDEDDDGDVSDAESSRSVEDDDISVYDFNDVGTLDRVKLS